MDKRGGHAQLCGVGDRLLLGAATAFAAVGWWWATIDCFILAGQTSGPTLLIGREVGPLSLGAGGTTVLVVAGLAGILAWPALAGAAMKLDVGLARWLLGPSREASSRHGSSA
jgi:hypothetical protein